MSLIPYQKAKVKRQRTKVQGNIFTFLFIITVFLTAPQALFAATQSSVSQFGVTWTFDKAYEVGKFVNGEWWVVGPVTITSITPKPGGGNNGTMINPVVGPGLTSAKEPNTKQGFDSQAVNYSASLMKIPPFPAAVNSSVISTISDPNHTGEAKSMGWLKSACVLTVLASPPPAGSFRPQFMAGEKKLYSANNLRRDLLLSLPKVANTPALATLENKVGRPWLMFLHGFTARAIHPSDYMQGYGGNVVKDVSQLALRLMLDDPLQAKEKLLVGFTQAGIDLWGIFKAGNYWPSRGGHNQGRKWPIVFAATMLDDPEMKTIGTMKWTGRFEKSQPIIWDAHGAFQEDCNTHYYNGNFDYDGGYCYKQEHTTSVESYQKCCNSHPWVGQILSAHLLRGAVQVWNWPALFEYEDWWVNTKCIPTDFNNNSCGGYGVKFADNMWVAYRDFAPPPVASVSFFAVNLSGVPPLDVTFTNTSSNDYSTWLWNFGDGTTSTLKAPSHTYTQIGVYTVTLTGTGTNGSDTYTKTNYVTVNDPAFAPTIIEAENMTLSNGYLVDNGAKLIGTAIVIDAALTVPATGTATTTWSGASGVYNITLSAIPENDGQPTVKLYVNSTLHINEILPIVGNINYTKRQDYTINNITINQGDVIKIEGTSAFTTGFAGARVDKIILQPVSTITSIGNDYLPNQFGAAPLDIYPSPVSALVDIKLGIKHADLVQVLVHNVRGEEVFKQASLSSSTGTLNLNMENLENGIYVIKVQANGTTVTREIMIVK